MYNNFLVMFILYNTLDDKLYRLLTTRLLYIPNYIVLYTFTDDKCLLVITVLLAKINNSAIMLHNK